ncbi:MAG: late competence development ComFB family protein [Schwartzia sp.]|nr:late competence development ComFB family protein [Schwartzia sp. (in: firmicutes)]
MELVNQTEKYVLEELDSVLAKYPDCCKCEHCRQDIAIIALNNLPAKYVSTEKGCVFAKLDALSLEGKIVIIEQIAKAVEIVKRNPHHETK